MPVLEIKFFNGFETTAAQKRITHFYSQKTKALLAYLVLEAAQRPLERTHLAALLWADYPDSRARRNLSQTLTALRKDLGDVGQTPPLFQTTTQTIGFNDHEGVFVDVLAFEACLTDVQQHQHANLTACERCTESLEQAAALYTGDLLGQFGLSDSNPFEDWLVAKRENLLQQAIEAFTQLSNSYAARGRIAEGLEIIDRLLPLAPWLEVAHRQRMLFLAQLGQRIQALNQYEVLTTVLMQELGVTPAAETDALYDQILSGEIELAVKTPPVSASSTNHVTAPPPFQAPAISPHFVGRESEFAQIQQLIEQYTTPVALVGMGGIGKTTLAAFTAHQLKARFTDGVLWGNPLTSNPLNILDQWARAYGHDFSSLTDIESKATAVRGVLAHKEVLIVLDNVEDTADVRLLLPSGERCQVLLTTRNLDAAATLNAQLLPIYELTLDTSQTLMIRILGQERVLGHPEEAAAAQRIAEQLHHLPLAIEIAAQRLISRPRMTLAALAARLEDTQQRLGLKISDQAVRSSFEISWAGLTPLAQQTFVGMALFAGRSFTAEALATVTDLDLYDLEDELYSLVALSLVHETGDVRYQQHLLLADFAAEKLATRDSQIAQRRFSQYYLAFAQTHRQQNEQLTPERENLNSAIETAFELMDWQTVLAFTDVMAHAWVRFSYFQDADQAYKLAEQAAKRLDDDTTAKWLAHTYLRWAEIESELNRYDQAWAHLAAALPYFYAAEEDAQIAQATYYQGLILFEQGEYAKAEAPLRESQMIFAELGDAAAEGRALVELGWLYYEMDAQLGRAEEMGQRALALFDRHDLEAPAAKIAALRLLALVALRQQDLDQAEQLAHQAADLGRQWQNPAEEGAALYILVGLHNTRQNYKEAITTGRVCLALFERLGNRRFTAMVGYQLGVAHKYLNELDQALKRMQTAQAIYREIEDRLGYGYALWQVGDIYIQTQRPVDAKQAYQEALQLAEYLQHDHLKAEVTGRLERHQL